MRAVGCSLHLNPEFTEASKNVTISFSGVALYWKRSIKNKNLISQNEWIYGSILWENSVYKNMLRGNFFPNALANICPCIFFSKKFFLEMKSKFIARNCLQLYTHYTEDKTSIALYSIICRCFYAPSWSHVLVQTERRKALAWQFKSELWFKH